MFVCVCVCVCLHVQGVLPMSRDQKSILLSEHVSNTHIEVFAADSEQQYMLHSACLLDLLYDVARVKGQRGSCGEIAANSLRHRRNSQNSDLQQAEPQL